MRRTLFAVAVALVAGCGIGVVGEYDAPVVAPPPEGGSDPTPLPEAAPFDGAMPDATVDAGPPRPDAGVGNPFEPTHIGIASYTLPMVADTMITGGQHWTIDTAAAKIDRADGNGLVSSPADLVVDAQSGAVVWSIGTLTIAGDLTVTGDRPLAIVVNGDFTVNGGGAIHASAVANVAGPGGSAPGAGAGKGGDGTVNTTVGGGGGGGGHGSVGGGGATFAGLAGSQAGVSTNPDGVTLVGGSGGGSTKTGYCPNDGLGGGGGGAIQVSSVGAIVVAGTIDVDGGGGLGGCHFGTVNAANPATGGGGGGAGGLIFLESAVSVTLNGGSLLAARGGGGGEGGGTAVNEGADANGGSGGFGFTIKGSDGGDGATKDDAASSGTAPDGDDNSGGGGGGGLGRVVLHARGMNVTLGGGATVQAVQAPIASF